jgi:hypothetical protein
MEDSYSRADLINRSCTCRSLDPKLLAEQLEKEPLLQGMYEEIISTRPHLFSSTMVFISKSQRKEIESVISACEKVIHTSSYQRKVLEEGPSIAKCNYGPFGAFMGFDFHLTEKGPKLIEINTNAGGALLSAELARAHKACCADAHFDVDIEQTILNMFLNEWKTQRGNARLLRIAIVDEEPEKQYLVPEFKLFERLFSGAGIESVICDVNSLDFVNQELSYQGKKIDMVYSRVTDFYFEGTKYEALRAAYLEGKVVVTPNPHHHALYANKYNLVILSNKEEMNRLQIAKNVQEILLAGVPTTIKVEKEKAEKLWAKRKNLFFKPSAGYGSKATYRGDKITKRVWSEILSSDYVAQEIVPASQRLVVVDGKLTDLKLDLRAYVFRGRIQLLTSRLYSGQTTNFRTSGGGFAPVSVLDKS